MRVASVVVCTTGIAVDGEVREWSSFERASVRSFFVVSRLTVAFSGRSSAVVWGRPSEVRSLCAEISAMRNSWARAMGAEFTEGLARARRFLDSDRYLSRPLRERFRQEHAALFGPVLKAARVLAMRGEPLAASYVEPFCDFDDSVARRNGRWSLEEQARWSELFDTLEAHPMTSEQRKAVVDFEDRNLLIAAAGSGKSATLVAKIVYAVRKRLVRPDEVLALAFNKKAAEELESRIREQALPDGNAIRSLTFHALGNAILGERKKQNIASDRDRRLKAAYDQLRGGDPRFRQDVALFVTNFTPDIRDRTKFASYEEYLEYVRNAESRRGRVGRRIVTLSGDNVASLEEMKLANWLFVHGVRYEYERVYPHVDATAERRGYTPDFYYPDIDTWHEHFGVDAEGVPAPCNGDPDEYLRQIQWKRERHEAFGTRWFETTSAQFANDTVFEVLERQLKECGQCFRKLSGEEIEARLGESHHHDEFLELAGAFFAHWKGTQIPFETLMQRGTPRDRAFLPLARRVYEAYEEALRQERRVDFDDLILGATRLLRSGEWSSPFKLILVDEFQDISSPRAELLRALLAQQPDAVLFCVGDDWQAINGFAGSNLGIMRNFEREFGPHVENRLTRTFRSNQGIASVAREFVLRNPSQLPKEVVAVDPTCEDVLRLVRYARSEEVPEAYVQIATEIARAGRCSVKVLGRYRKNESGPVLEVFRRLAPLAEVEFNTMHGSKGLQADYVVLDRLEARGAFAFPSMVTDDSILRLVMPEREPFPHAEERRLMYVALTRAKKRVYLLAPRERPSPFVTELERREGPGGTEPVFACPYCKNGSRVRRAGKHGAFWSCSRFPDCDGKPPKALRRTRATAE